MASAICQMLSSSEDDIDEDEFLDIDLSADRALYLSHAVRTEGITAK